MILMVNSYNIIMIDSKGIVKNFLNYMKIQKNSEKKDNTTIKFK
jgi:hypothetical protein